MKYKYKVIKEILNKDIIKRKSIYSSNDKEDILKWLQKRHIFLNKQVFNETSKDIEKYKVIRIKDYKCIKIDKDNLSYLKELSRKKKRTMFDLISEIIEDFNEESITEKQGERTNTLISYQAYEKVKNIAKKSGLEYLDIINLIIKTYKQERGN